MKKEYINNGMITLTLAEGFHVMTKEEIASFGEKNVKDTWAAKDEELHLLYNIVWNKVSFLTAGVSVEKMLHNSERKIAKKVPAYMKIGDVKKTLAGQEVCGIRYSYRVQETDMIGEYLLFQYKKQNIAMGCLGRKGFFDENYGVFEEIFSTIELQ